MNLQNEKFLKVYKFLFEDEKFIKLSIDAKVTYSIMLERNYLSIQNNLRDDNGYYIILRITEIQKILNCGNQKAGKILNELELVGLIDKRKQGSSNPDLIYLKNFKVKCENQKCENHTTNDVKCENQKCENHIYNKTNINKTNINKTNISKNNIQSGALAPDNNRVVKITTQEQGQKQIFKIPLKNGDYYTLYQEQVEFYKSLYPNINIEQELRNIIGWNIANLNKRKSLKGIKKHINFWLQKSNSNALEKQENFNQKEKCVNVVYEPNYSKDDFLSL